MRKVGKVPFVMERTPLYRPSMLNRRDRVLALVLGCASAETADVLHVKDDDAGQPRRVSMVDSQPGQH